MGTDYRQPLAESVVRSLFGEPCDEDQFDRFDIPVLGSKSCHTLVGPQLQRIFAAIDNDGLAGYKDTFDGIYNCRKMQGGNRYSHHSWGIAIDLNACELPNGSEGDDINFGKHGEFPHLRRLMPYFIAEGWAAGIQWQNTPDPMHFEARSAHGTGLLAAGSLKGLDLRALEGLTDQDLAYLRTYDEYAWAFQSVARVCQLPNGQQVAYQITDGERASVLLANLAAAMGWDVDTAAWPTIRCTPRA